MTSYPSPPPPGYVYVPPSDDPYGPGSVVAAIQAAGGLSAARLSRALAAAVVERKMTLQNVYDAYAAAEDAGISPSDLPHFFRMFGI